MALRRSIATSEPKKTISMDPTIKKHSSLPNTNNTSTPQSDQFPSSTLNKIKPHYPKPKPNYSSSLLKSQDPSRIHTHLHSKSLTLSTNSDSSLLKKPHHHQLQKPSKQICVVMEKQNPKKEKEKIKLRKPSAAPTAKQGRRIKEEEEEVEELKRPSISLISGGGRRKSFCDSKIELSDFFNSVVARVVAVDMPPFMQIHAISCARKAHDSLEKPSSKYLACTLKKEFDGVYGPAWHCIVGTSFGSFVTHSVGGFLYFSMDHKLYFLLFKTTVQKAD